MNDQIIEIAISGGMGKMGQLVSEFIESKEGYKVSGIYDPGKQSNDFDNFESIDEITADILFEFSPADQINKNLSQLMDKDINLIIGSSGLDPETINELESTISENQFIFVIPNFSVGASLQKIISNIADQNFKNVTIEERHHINKKDAPSGTAIDLATSLNTVNEESQEDSSSDNYESNTVNNVHIKSIRGEEYIAEQTVTFKNSNESLTIDHVVNDRSAYLQGINYILDEHSSLKGFHHGLENIMIDRFKI